MACDVRAHVLDSQVMAVSLFVPEPITFPHISLVSIFWALKNRQQQAGSDGIFQVTDTCIGIFGAVSSLEIRSILFALPRDL